MGKKTYGKADITKYGQYYPAKEGKGFCIRREVYLYTNKVVSERLPKKDYASQIDKLENPEEIWSTLVRICKQKNIQQFGRAYEEKLAMKTLLDNNPWITPSIRREFEKYIYANRKNASDGKHLYGVFESKFLKFFLDLKKVKDPHDWPTVQFSWGLSLMNKPDNERLRIWDKEDYPAKKTIITIVQVANQFINWAKTSYPKEFGTLAELNPISRSQMESHESQRKFKGLFNEGFYMPENHWNEVATVLQDDDFINTYLKGYDIYPFIKLSYEYGLRRSESLGVQLKDVKPKFLSVERQIENMRNGEPQTSPTKGKLNRKTPHWNIEATPAYYLIDRIGKDRCQIVHPDTLTEKFKVAIDYLFRLGKIDKDYSIHDLRRTFITNALQSQTPLAVQMASGHKNITTTMGYIRDDRGYDENEAFVPPEVKDNVVKLKKKA